VFSTGCQLGYAKVSSQVEAFVEVTLYQQLHIVWLGAVENNVL
jgi:hypothetical protein